MKDTESVFCPICNEYIGEIDNLEVCPICGYELSEENEEE